MKVLLLLWMSPVALSIPYERKALNLEAGAKALNYEALPKGRDCEDPYRKRSHGAPNGTEISLQSSTMWSDLQPQPWESTRWTTPRLAPH